MRTVPEFTPCPVCGGSGVVDPASGQLDEEQTRQDSDQTASDRDQIWSDHDQTASDSDQRSSDADQRIADAELAAGGDPAAHDRSAAARARTTHDRLDVTELRDETGEDRDRGAEARDRDADARDRLAELHEAIERDAGTGDPDDVRQRAELARARAATYRARAAEDRKRAAADRVRAAADRALAVAERQQAALQQAEARRALMLAATDDLTGAWTRKVGLDNVDREIQRARRMNGTLTLAFIDVDGLKDVNDRQGHAEGDDLLRRVVAAVRTNVRPYDVVVRYGGDEFLCAMPGLALAAAQERMETIAAALRTATQRHAITFGLAELGPDDDLEALVGRADAVLLQARDLHRDG